MTKLLAKLEVSQISVWIEKNTADILVALVPLQQLIVLLLSAWTDIDAFPLALPWLSGIILLIGTYLLIRLKAEKQTIHQKELIVIASSVLLIFQSAIEIANNGNNGAWIWFGWAYITAVTALIPSLLKAGALLILNLVATAIAIQLGKTAYSPIQMVPNYLLFGLQSIGLCLLMLHFLRQQHSTVKKRYRQKLRKYHEMNFFFQNMSSPVFVKDDQNNLINLNEAAAKLFNSTRYHLIGKNLDEILPKEMASAMLKEDLEILALKETKSTVRMLHLPALSEPQWFKISKKAFEFQHPKRRGLVVSVENIHEQISYEEQLRESEKRFRTIFEKAPVGMMMVRDCFNSFIEVNDALCMGLGYSRDELLHKTPADVTHPADKLKAFPLIEEAWEKGYDFITLEKRFLHRSGQVIHALVALQMVREKGQSSHLIGMVLDFSERKKFEIDLERKSEQIKESNESLKEFAYAASHDLKEPLRTISSFTNLMLRYLPKEQLLPEVLEFAEHIKSGVARMDRLISGLLEYSRIGNSQMRFEYTDPIDVIISVCSNLGNQIKENKAELDVQVPIPQMVIDPLKFESLLQNLISNSIKYRRPDHHPLIKLKVEELESHWLFTLEDNGKGIPSDQVEKVFGLYQRLEEDQHEEGSGVGLSLCKRIVSRHGGKIWIESELGVGSKFFFTISKEAKATSKKEFLENSYVSASKV